MRIKLRGVIRACDYIMHMFTSYSSSFCLISSLHSLSCVAAKPDKWLWQTLPLSSTDLFATLTFYFIFFFLKVFFFSIQLSGFTEANTPSLHFLCVKVLTELTGMLLYRSLSVPLHYHTGFIGLLSFLPPPSNFVPHQFLSLCTCAFIMCPSLCLSFCLPLHTVHFLCQLLANPSSNPVKERYAVSSYLG